MLHVGFDDCEVTFAYSSVEIEGYEQLHSAVEAILSWESFTAEAKAEQIPDGLAVNPPWS